ncbi:MAG: ABC transporter permease [Halobacteriovoraceae bacterium]|nr:ABC transporter permease [Halobacteriovoraceae bacterium]
MNIWSYVFRRILYIFPILLGVCLIIFIMFNVVAPDPARVMLGKHASVEQMEQIRRELGLNRSPVVQYIDVVKSAFTFDFGRSWSTKQKISEMISQGIIPSLTISLPSFILSSIIAICISLVVSFFRGKLIDKTIVFACVALMSISSLAYILFGQYFLAFKLGIFEISGYEFPNFLPYVALPVLIWIFLNVGPDVRFFRTIMLDEIYQDYVRTARAKGLSEFKIMFKHVLKNSMISILTYLVIQIPYLILGSLLLENFFSIPGLGSIIVDAINASDFPVLKAMTILGAVGLIFFSVLTDVMYALFDPRARLK